MKIENKLENKAKFFAQYWHQTAISKITNAKLILGSASMYDIVNGQFDLWRILLKPLSQITDEDALECYKIHFKGHLDKDIRPDESRINFSKKYIINPIEVCILEVTDYLRSKGYELPYMGLSVEELISYGWVKLKQNEND